MTGMAGCREIKQALGVYVLGAIDPAERAQVDEHLATCPECREELASLAGLPAMLRKVPVVEAERLAAAEQDPELAGVPSPEMLTSLIARTTNVRRIRPVARAGRGRGRGTGGRRRRRRRDQRPAVRQLRRRQTAHVAAWQQTTGTGPVAGAHLTVRYRHEAWGTQMEVNVTGLRPGSVCEFQVTDKAGGKLGGGQLDAVAGDRLVPGIDLAWRERTARRSR